jgi:signal transduction histidine kinase
VIDPTAALPIHFTIETLVLSAAGLLLAWASVRRHWPAVAGSLALAVIQGLHAGQFIQQEDDPLLFSVRLAALALLGATIVPVDPRRWVIGGGLLALFAGSLWGGIVGGGPENLAIGPHLVMFAGAAALLWWVWQATRPSVRLRVLAAFVSVLAVAVVVAGGAVARVAAVDARNERYGTLGLEASTIAREVAQTREVLARRAATLSPVVAIGTSRGSPTLERSRVLAGEWVVVLNADGRRLTAIAAEGVEVPHKGADFAPLAVVRRSLEGDVSSSTGVIAEALQVIAAAPIFRPGSEQAKSDVIGTIVVGSTLEATELKDLTGDPIVDVAIVGTSEVATTDERLASVARDANPPTDVAFDTIGDSGDGWLASFVRIPDGDTYLVVVASDDIVVEAATDLVRAFLIAILAAALLAVVAALWLSARITRPMLQLADDAERVKTDFLASVSHELRTPLTPIRGYTEILRSRSVPARDRSGYLDEIGQAAQRLERIVALLVDVAAIEAGRFKVMVDEVSAESIVGDTIERWRERSKRLEPRVARGLPPVRADAAAISRVLDELIDNAVKFGGDTDVELRARLMGNEVEFSVRDAGPGIDAERLAAVRGAFRQAESGDTRRFGGLGLGLTFVEGVLHAHASKLDIKSVTGTGTTCSFVLPAAPALAGKVARMPPKAQQRKAKR